MSDWINVLKEADIFYQFTAAQLEMISQLGSEKKFKRDEVIINEGTPSTDLYIIIEGEVDIRVNPSLVGGPSSPNGDVTIATLRRSQCFGEVALVDEGVRSATVRASQKDTRLVVISREKILILCETYPQLGYRLMHNLAANLAMKLRNTDLRIREIFLHDQEQKKGDKKRAK